MKKRLLFISNLYPNIALPNQATFNYQQVNKLKKWFDVYVISPIPWWNRSVIKLIRMNERDHAATYPTYWYTPGILRHLYGWMMLASIFLTAQRIHHARPFDIILGAWLYPDGWVATRLARYWKIPCYLKVHGSDVNRLVPDSALTKVSLSAIQSSQGVFCVSKAIASRLITLGTPAPKCRVVYNGVDSKIFYPRDKMESRLTLGLSRSDRFVLFIGNLLESKGLRELVSAFAGIAREELNLYLLVVGTGAWKNSLIEEIKNQGVSQRVLLVGSVNHREIPIWLNATDVLCLPSYAEGLPNVVLEALACNIPAVVTAVGGVPELAELDDRIFLVEPGNVVSLKSGLQSVLNLKKSCEKRLVIRSWQGSAAKLASIMLDSEIGYDDH